MKKRNSVLTVVFTVVLMLGILASSGGAQEVEAPSVLLFDMDALPADVDAFVADAGGQLLFWFPEVGVAVVSGGSGFAGNAAVEAVGPTGQWSLPTSAALPEVLDAPTAADYFYDPYQWSIRRVNAPMAWAMDSSGSHNTVVAVIDTGIDASHPDLAPNVLYEACMQLAGPCAPGTFTHWHGTHVGGTVAAAFDGGAAVGVGPNLGLAAYQVFEAGGAGAWDGPIWWAIMDAAHQGFDVINMSLGDYGDFAQSDGEGAAVWRAWNRVINYAVRGGVTVVASAGNGAVDVNGSLYHIPGDLPGIINVAATGIQSDPFFPQDGFFDIQAFYSNYGAAVDISAPGGDCGELDGCSGAPPSGYPYYWYLVFSTYPGGYAWSGGTSMASPHVAGAAGLVKDANPGLNPHQVKAILTRTADKIGSRQIFGHGMLDVGEAVWRASK